MEYSNSRTKFHLCECRCINKEPTVKVDIFVGIPDDSYN